MSAMVTCLSLWKAAKRETCSPFITVPSSFINSEMTPTGGRPLSLQRSTAASVWPERSNTQPARVFGGDRRADDARRVADDERHLLGGAQRGRDDQIAFAFPVFIIGD